MAKSCFAACDRANPVTSDVGSRLSTPAIPDSRPWPLTSARFARMRALISANRAAGSIGPAGTDRRDGVNELPPIARSVRVLTTKLVRNDVSGTPRAS